MTVYLVTVLVGNSIDRRYFDSIWVQKKNADERVRQLRQELRRANIPVESDDNPTQFRWAVRLTTAECADANVVEQPAGDASGTL